MPIMEIPRYAGWPNAELTISSDERPHLSAITRSRLAARGTALRTKIVLAFEREPSNAVVATRLDVGPHKVGKWGNRFHRRPDRGALRWDAYWQAPHDRE